MLRVDATDGQLKALLFSPLVPDVIIDTIRQLAYKTGPMQDPTQRSMEQSFTTPTGHAGGSYDVVIYGGTSAGIVAAVQVKRMGRSVIVIEPTSRIGRLTTGGLGWTDIPPNQSVPLTGP